LKSGLVALESGSIDAIAYLDDFVDASGILQAMNSRCRDEDPAVYAGRRLSPSGGGRDAIPAMVNVLNRWPTTSADLNSIKNLWVLLKTWIEEENHGHRAGRACHRDHDCVDHFTTNGRELVGALHAAQDSEIMRQRE
jgi:hypothetical protein